MRTFFVFAVALFATTASAQTGADRTPDGLIRFVYEHYVGKSASDDVSFNWLDKPLVDQLFEPELAAAIVKDSENTEESALGADPFVNGQDFEVKSADPQIVSQTADRARIDVKLVNFGEASTIGYDLVRTPSGWRIRDVIWGGEEPDTLRKTLKLP